MICVLPNLQELSVFQTDRELTRKRKMSIPKVHAPFMKRFLTVSQGATLRRMPQADAMIIYPRHYAFFSGQNVHLARLEECTYFSMNTV